MSKQVTHDLEKERRAVEALRAKVSSDDLEIAIEGETNLIEAIQHCSHEIDEAEMMMVGIDARVEALGERKSRLDTRIKALKAAIQRAMEEVELPKLVLDDVTISMKRVPPALQVTDETKIDEAFFIQPPPRLDRKSLMDALKTGQVVIGATLSNGSQTISFRKG